MTIENFIEGKTQQKEESEPLTVRVPKRMAAQINELAYTLEVHNQELMFEFLKDGLSRALAHYAKFENNPSAYDMEAMAYEAQKGEGGRNNPAYVFVNTNKSNNNADHAHMVSQGIAAAFFGDWKFKIDTLQKDDIVFLYESGVGIVGVGKASGDLEVLDKDGCPGEMHQQQLQKYHKVKPLSARQIKKITGVNHRFCQSMFRVAPEQGTKIKENLMPIYPLDLVIEGDMDLEMLKKIVHDKEDLDCESFPELPAVCRDVLIEQGFKGKALKDVSPNVRLGAFDDAMSKVYDMRKQQSDDDADMPGGANNP